MKAIHRILKALRPSAVASTAFLVTASIAQGVPFPVAPNTPEVSGVALGPGSSGFSGTLIDSWEVPFSSIVPILPAFTGILRSMVVDSGPGYDFYYQMINTSVAGPNSGLDIFRLAIPGYGQGQFSVSATYLTDGVATISAVGAPIGWASTFLPNKGILGGVWSADRDSTMNTPEFHFGGAAFDFDASHFFNLNVPGGPTTAPNNINAGENSDWLVFRTNSHSYAPVTVVKNYWQIRLLPPNLYH